MKMENLFATLVLIHFSSLMWTIYVGIINMKLNKERNSTHVEELEHNNKCLRANWEEERSARLKLDAENKILLNKLVKDANRT